LTAAHCIKPSDVQNNPIVRIGELCRFISSPDQQNCGQYQEDIPIQSITIHAEYTNAHKGKDVALLRLSKPSTIQPVPIDTNMASMNYNSGTFDTHTHMCVCVSSIILVLYKLKKTLSPSVFPSFKPRKTSFDIR